MGYSPYQLVRRIFSINSMLPLLLGAMTLSYPLLLAMCRLASASSGCACADDGWWLLICWNVGGSRVEFWVFHEAYEAFEGKWYKCLSDLFVDFCLAFHLSFKFFGDYTHINRSFQGSPKPIWPWKKATGHIRKHHWKLRNQRTFKGAKKKVIKIHFHICHRLKPLKLKMMGFGKKWRKKSHHSPRPWFHSLSSRPGTENLHLFWSEKTQNVWFMLGLKPFWWM